MTTPVKHYMGLDGFVWFVGVIEDRMDPEKLNRVRVRCYGFHSESKEDIPTEDLPWANCVVPPTNPAAYSPKEGDWVVGFFMDAYDAQQPVIMGILPGKPKAKPKKSNGFADPNGVYPKYVNEPTTTRLARGDIKKTVIETIKKQRKKNVRSTRISGKRWDEPEPQYGAKYPYNYAHETESGHAFEMDDTKGKERVNLAHKIGTVIEFSSKGDRVDHIHKDKYSVTMGSDFMYVKGSCSITVDGDCDMKIGGKWNVEAGEINICATRHVKIKGGSKTQIESGGGMDIKAGGSMKVGGGGKASFGGSSAVVYGAKVDLAGAFINIPGGSPSFPKGTGLSSGGLEGFVPGAAIGTLDYFNFKGLGLIDAIGNPLGDFKTLLDTGGLVAGLAGGLNFGAITSALAATSQFSNLTKEIAGITSTVSSVYGDAQNLINQGNSLLKQALPLGQLENGLQTIEGGLNSLSGDILNLSPNQITNIQTSAGSLVQRAAESGVTMDLSSIVGTATGGATSPVAPGGVLSIGAGGTQEPTSIIAKELFPRTITFPISPISSNTSGT